MTTPPELPDWRTGRSSRPGMVGEAFGEEPLSSDQPAFQYGGEAYWGDEPARPSPYPDAYYQLSPTEKSYAFTGTFDSFMSQEPFTRVSAYNLIAVLLVQAPETVSDRDRRMLAWAVRHDDRAMNLLHRRKENQAFSMGNWFHSGGIGEALLPWDPNSIRSDQAQYIDDMWLQHGDALTDMASLLDVESLKVIAEHNGDDYLGGMLTASGVNALRFGEADRFVDFSVDSDGVLRTPAAGREAAGVPDVRANYGPMGAIASGLDYTMSGVEWLVLGSVYKNAAKLTGSAMSRTLLPRMGNVGRAVKGSFVPSRFPEGTTAGMFDRTTNALRTGGAAAAGVVGRGAGGVATAISNKQLAAWNVGTLQKWLGNHPAMRNLWRTKGRPTVSWMTTAGIVSFGAAANLQWAFDQAGPEDVHQQMGEIAQMEGVLSDAIISGTLPATPDLLSAASFLARTQRVLGLGGGTGTAPTTPTTPATPGAPPTTTSDTGAPTTTSGTGTATGTAVTTPSGISAQDITLGEVGSPEGVRQAPPPLLGEGLEDQYVRDAEGRIVAGPGGYQGYGPGGAYSRPAGNRMYMGQPSNLFTVPQYREGDPLEILNNMTPSQSEALVAQLLASGLLKDTTNALRYTSGMIDQDLIDAFSAVLENANYNTLDWQAQLDHEVAAAEAIREESAEANWIPFGRFTYLPPNYATMAQDFKSMIRTQLGRDPTSAEITLYADEFQAQDRLDQRQTYRTEKAKFETKQWNQNQAAGTPSYKEDFYMAPVEDPSTGGIDPSAPFQQQFGRVPVPRPKRPRDVAPTADIDVAAQMAEWFEQRYGGEIDLRQRINQDAANFATMISGSQALTNRVRGP